MESGAVMKVCMEHCVMRRGAVLERTLAVTWGREPEGMVNQWMEGPTAVGQDCWSLNWNVRPAVGNEGRQAGLIVEGPVLNIKEFTLDFVGQCSQPCLMIRISRAIVNMQIPRHLPWRF